MKSYWLKYPHFEINPDRYKQFYGKAVDVMPEIIADGRKPMSVAELMKRRIEVSDDSWHGLFGQMGKGISKSVKGVWNDNSFSTGDGIVYHPDGRIKIVLDVQPLQNINPNSNIRDGALILPAGVYESIEGVEFSKQDIEHMLKSEIGSQCPTFNRSRQAVSNPIMQILARDKDLLQKYYNFIVEENYRTRGWDRTMSTYLGLIFMKPDKSEPSARLWYLNHLGEYGLSIAVGGYDLRNAVGNHIGIMQKDNLKKSVSTTGDTLEGRVQTELNEQK